MRLSVIASLIALSASAVSATVDRVVVFADSYTDNGNDYKNSEFPPSPPYYAGRFRYSIFW